MLNVERRKNIDPSGDDFLDIEIAFRVSAARRVRMSELVDEHERWAALDDRIQIHLSQEMALVLDLPPRDHFEAFEKRFGLPSPMRFDDADDNVDPLAPPGLGSQEHLIGFAHSRRCAEKNLEPASALLLRGGEQCLG